MWVNKTGNKISKEFNNAGNTKNILRHEKFHQDDDESDPNFVATFYTHCKVYLKQLTDPTFAETTGQFQIDEIAVFANHLMNAKYSGFSNRDIDAMTKEFNANNHLGYSIEINMNRYGSYEATLYQNKKLLTTIQFQQIPDPNE